jgi:hypothetical protein
LPFCLSSAFPSLPPSSLLFSSEFDTSNLLAQPKSESRMWPLSRSKIFSKCSNKKKMIYTMRLPIAILQLPGLMSRWMTLSEWICAEIFVFIYFSQFSHTNCTPQLCHDKLSLSNGESPAQGF